MGASEKLLPSAPVQLQPVVGASEVLPGHEGAASHGPFGESSRHLRTAARRTLLRQISGPALTAGATAILAALSATQLNIITPAPILQLLVVYAALTGGMSSGLISAAIGWLYSAYDLSLPGQLFGYADDGFRHLAVLTLTLPLTAVLVDTLKRRSQAVAGQETDHAEAEAADRRFRDLVQGLDAIVWEGDPQTFRFTFVSQPAEDILGYSVEQWLKDPQFWLNVVHPEDRERAARLYQAAADERSNQDFEYRALAASGRVVWLRNIVRVVQDTGSRAPQLRGVMVDVTERKQMEEAHRFLAEAGTLLAASLDYQSTLQHVAHLAVPYLADLCIVDILEEAGEINRMAVAYADPAKDQWARALQRRYVPEEDAGSPETAPHGVSLGVLRVLRTGGPEIISSDIPDPLEILFPAPAVSGSQEPLATPGHLPRPQPGSCMIVPLVARGRTLGTMMFITSESGRHYAEADMAIAEDLARRCAMAVDNGRLYQEVQQTVRTRDELLSSAVHDLNTPLTSIRGFAQLLRRQATRASSLAPDRLLDGLSRINTAATQMGTLVNELLDVARLQMGSSLELDRRPTDLVALAQQAVAAHQHATEQHRLQLRTGDPQLVGHWDAARLERVLTNLISNAIKYSPKGGDITVTVARAAPSAHDLVMDTERPNQSPHQPERGGQVSRAGAGRGTDGAPAGTRATEGSSTAEAGEAGSAGTWAVLAVQDQGLGIPVEDLSRVFERFQRAGNVVGQIPGSGIGLATTRRIIEQHGGTIAVQSREGKGSTFTVRLPLTHTRA